LSKPRNTERTKDKRLIRKELIRKYKLTRDLTQEEDINDSIIIERPAINKTLEKRKLNIRNNSNKLQKI